MSESASTPAPAPASTEVKIDLGVDDGGVELTQPASQGSPGSPGGRNRKGKKKNRKTSIQNVQPIVQTVSPFDAFINHVKNDDTSSMKMMLAADRSLLSMCDPYQSRTALHFAAFNVKPEAAKLLLDNGAHASQKDANGATALDLCVKPMKEKDTRDAAFAIAMNLKNAGCSLNCDKFGPNFVEACADGDLVLVDNLMKLDAQFKLWSDYDKRSGLHLAVCEGHVSVVQFLLGEGADKDFKDRWGRSPKDEALRHASRSGVNAMKALFLENEEHGDWFDTFSYGMTFMEIIMLVIMFVVGDYDDLAKGLVAGDTFEDADAMMKKYGQFMDVHVMIFIGFGYLMTFLRFNAFNSVGFTFLIGAVSIQWHIIVHWVVVNAFGHTTPVMALNLDSLILGDFCAGAVLITYGVVLGKLSCAQMMFVTFFEVVFFSINEEIGITLGITDVGGSMVVHMFGAFFGLALSKTLADPKRNSDNDNNSSVYNSDLFAMIGTVFLWMYWPSFNGALTADSQQMRVVVNTVLSLCGSCVFSFVASYVLHRERKFFMVDIQNATLAGGVAMGTAADMFVQPGGAFAIGAVAGIVSTFGYTCIQPWLEARFGVHDTCGVNNLHGMPSIVGALAGVIATSMANKEQYGDQWESLAWNQELPTAQAERQLYFLLITLGVSMASGAMCGVIILKLGGNDDKMESEDKFNDKLYWEVPNRETPYYFDERGEVQRNEIASETTQNDSEDTIRELEKRLKVVESVGGASFAAPSAGVAATGGVPAGMGGGAVPMNGGFWIPPAQPAPAAGIEDVLTRLLDRIDGRGGGGKKKK